jgi:hypothetical protein
VVYRTLDGTCWDISKSVTSPDIPVDNGTAFDIVRPFESVTEPRIGFSIRIKALEAGGEFSGTFSSSANEARPWRGKCIGMTHVPLAVVENPLQPLDPAFKTFLAITPLGNDGKGGFVDMAQVGSNELFRDVRHYPPQC